MSRGRSGVMGGKVAQAAPQPKKRVKKEETARHKRDVAFSQQQSQKLRARYQASTFHVNAGGVDGHIKPDMQANSQHVVLTAQDGTQVQIDWNVDIGGFDVRAVRAQGPEDQGLTASSLDIVPLSGNVVCIRPRMSPLAREVYGEDD